MKLREFDVFMRQFESSSVIVPIRNWIVLHVDGDNFHRWTKEQELVRPFDKTLRQLFDKISERIMVDMGGILTLHQSDEMSILIPNTSDYLKRSVPKLVSKSVALATTTATNLMGVETLFATRVFTLPTVDSVIDYYRWRLADAVRNSLNMCVYWTLRDVDGVSGKVAASTMNGKDVGWKNEYLFERGINFDELEDWKKRGHLLYWITNKAIVMNVHTEKPEEVVRRKLIVTFSPKDERVEFVEFLKKYIVEYQPKKKMK